MEFIMSTISTGIDTASTYLASGASQIQATRSISRIESTEKPFSVDFPLGEEQDFSSVNSSTDERTSTDTTGIVLSEEAQEFLASLEESEIPQVVSMSESTPPMQQLEEANYLQRQAQAEQTMQATNVEASESFEQATTIEANSSLASSPIFNTLGLMAQSSSYAQSQAINENMQAVGNNAENALNNLQTSAAVQAVQTMTSGNEQNYNQPENNSYYSNQQERTMQNAINTYQRMQTQDMPYAV